MGLPNNLGKLSNMITSTGSAVGVNTTTPFGIFNVVAGTNKSLIIQDSGIADTIEIASYSTSGGTRAIAMNGSVLTFGTGTAGGGSATPRLTINSTGLATFSNSIVLSATGYVGFGGGNNYMEGDNTNNILRFGTNNVTRLTINASGNVGIGTTSPQALLQVTSSAFPVLKVADGIGGGAVALGDSAISSNYVGIWRGQANSISGGGFLNIQGNGIAFMSGNDIFGNVNERGRFTSNGYFKARGSETSYYSATIPAHELRTGQGGEWNTIMTSTASDSYGLLIGLTPGLNNTGNELVAAYTGNFSTLKFKVASNGGIYNYTGNNVPLSDQRMKKEITPLESYWNKFKEIEMVKFKYIDQEHNDFNIGVVSQQIESIMPEFVDVWDKRNIPEDGKPLMGVYMEDIHNIAMKVLQEAMAKIEELSAKVTALENK